MKNLHIKNLVGKNESRKIYYEDLIRKTILEKLY